MANAMETLKEACGELSDIGSAAAVLAWDQQTYMPPKAAEDRGRQLAAISTIHHERLLDPKFDALLAELSGAALAGDDRLYVDEFQWVRERARRLPSDFVRENAMTQALAFAAWEEAKKKNDFSIYAPHLEKVLSLTRKAADFYGWTDHPWDALLQDHERGMSHKELQALFAGLRQRTVALLDRIKASTVQRDFSFLDGTWPADRQWDFGMQVLKDIGYDFEAGRQDRSTHPFTINLGSRDIRITTRLREDKLLDALSSTVHELGHALYEYGMGLTDPRSPLGQAASTGMHESQSRLWEIRIGQSRPFWRAYLPELKRHFPNTALDRVDEETFYAAVNRVQPSFIRVEADEVTYNLHIILRFEIELALIGGTLSVKDLPDAWNAKMQELLGITPPDDAHGCLQDVHWSGGGFGYFPSYTLGNVFAAMLMEQIEKDIPDLWQQVEARKFGQLLDWLRTHVHSKGRRLRAPQLIRQITGKELSSEPLLRYLESKYADIYGFAAQ
jgi:carboxypeptidase Taq